MNLSEFEVEMSNRNYTCQACDYGWSSIDKRPPKVCPSCQSDSIARVTGESLRHDAYWERLEIVLKKLTYREREVIKLRYGFGNGYEYNVRQLAQIFGCSTSCVYRVEATAIRKLTSPERIDKLKKLGLQSGYARLTLPEGLKRLIRKVLG